MNIVPSKANYYVDDGCHSENHRPDDISGFYQSESSTAYVRCCSSDGSSCKTMSQCYNSTYLVTYAKAKDECEANGMRLCTMDELLSDVCCGTGGRCDNYRIWTSTLYGSTTSMNGI